MKKVIIWYDPEGKCKQVITPFKQEGKNRSDLFDGNWGKLVAHVTHSTDDQKNYYKYEIV